MHLAGSWARHLYPSLRLACDAPSEWVVEETLRLGGLLHDIGHGPFGHFFDEQYLSQFEITHETLSQRIITGDLADLVRRLDASPHGAFARGESIDPAWVAYVISKEEIRAFSPPRWLELLKPVLCGPFAADNMDYVPRDAYMCGVSIGPVDVRRIIHYTFVSPEGIALHQHGAEAMLLFLTSRLYLYNNLYFHRTVRRIDLHMREIFRDTIDELLDGKNPLDNLEEHMALTDWHLLNEVDRWRSQAPEGSRRAHLSAEWAKIVGRHKLKWNLAFEAMVEYRQDGTGTSLPSPEELRRRLVDGLGRVTPADSFNVDVAALDARPEDPAGDRYTVLLYDPIDGRLHPDATAATLARLPMRNALLRVFVLDERDVGDVRRIAEQVLELPSPG
jgi:HD superfamily phosphohydrolase